MIGALGQVGTELVHQLRSRHGMEAVVSCDVAAPQKKAGVFERLDVIARDELFALVKRYRIQQIYHMAALLSATGEQEPLRAWSVNMEGLVNVLEVARQAGVAKVFWPSSIAVFGPNTPRHNTPQACCADPLTVYGISKLAGERLCAYYFHRYGLDVRSIRYPGLISYRTPPGGGTTDYAVEMYRAFLRRSSYTCFLSADARLPMMHIDDAVLGTLRLMEAEADCLQVRSSYNVHGISFSPAEQAAILQARRPSFLVNYQPDFRQQIAETWPESIADTAARRDWGWASTYDLEAITENMLENMVV